MIHSVFELGDTTVREVMVPRTDMVYVERHKNLRQTMSLFLRSGFSRVPVIGENLDDIVGFAYLKDIVRRDFEAPQAETTERIESVMRPAHWVPESKPVDELLREMQAQRQHIAVVVDEYGGTAGLITIEDLLEEIVGEITDEYDEEQIEVERLDDGACRVSSRYPVDDLDELFGFAVEEEDVEIGRRPDGQAPRPGADPGLHGRGARPALRGRGHHRPPQPGRHRDDLPGRGAGRRGRRRAARTRMPMSDSPVRRGPQARHPGPRHPRPHRAPPRAPARARRRRPHVRRRRPSTCPRCRSRALGVCVAMAVASGSSGLEAAVLLTGAGAGRAKADVAALRDLGGPASWSTVGTPEAPSPSPPAPDDARRASARWRPPSLARTAGYRHP